MVQLELEIIGFVIKKKEKYVPNTPCFSLYFTVSDKFLLYREVIHVVN